MRRTLSILLAAIMVLSCVWLAGCSEVIKDIPADSPYIGTWEAVTTVAFGKETPVTDEFGDGFILVLNADGTAQVFLQETTDCNWVITDKGIKLTGGTSLKLTYENDRLYTSVIGIKVYFDKK